MIIKGGTRLLFFCAVILSLCLFSAAPIAIGLDQNSPSVNNRGIWVSCFTAKKVLYSKEAVLELIEFCRQAKINQIYLQLYRADYAYYDSHIANRLKYEEIVKSAGTDTIDLLLQQATGNNIQVFAWINVLSLAENKTAALLVKFGDSILTKDQYLRPSMRSEQANDSDKYYLRDTQLFLEPGDLGVSQYMLSIAGEIVARYPGLSGIHLDYIRYPYPVPFLPNSKFNNYGLSYGYGENNTTRFKQATGLDPLTMGDEKDNCLIWDNWKRDQVTGLVKSISAELKSKAPKLLISCAVIASAERAYSVAFQDWPFWLEEGIVDYVVIMNYTRDSRLAKETARSALAHRGQGQVYIGLGAFLFKNDAELFFEQYKRNAALNPDGIVFFCYDDLNDEQSLWKKTLIEGVLIQ